MAAELRSTFEGRTMVLTISNPEHRNALGPEMYAAGVEALNVAVMGCIVNGPGESKHADIGISLPGTGEEPTAPVFVDGKKVKTLRGPAIAAEFKAMVADYVTQRYGRRADAAE